MKKEKLILVGGGGHCKSIIEVIESTDAFKIKGILDVAEKVGQKILGYEIIGTDADIEKYVKKGYSFHITIGHILHNNVRTKIYKKIKEASGSLPVIIASTALVSKHARVGEGTVMMHNSFVNANAVVGINCIVNTGAVIEHDAAIEDHCHISTGAYINGECKVGSDSFVGSRSILVQCTVVADHNVIAAGSVITENTEPYGLYAGNPAVLKRKNN